MKLPNEVLASRQAQVRWCSAVACVRGMRKHLHKQVNEQIRIAIDARAVEYASSGLTTNQLKELASFHFRMNTRYRCAAYVRAVIKRVLKDTRSRT